MKPTKKNMVILPPGELQLAAPPDAFREDRVLYDLARLAHSPGLFQTYVQRARVRFTKAAEKAMLEHWVSFYEAGGRLVGARLEMERRKSEYLQLARQHELKAKEKEAAMAAQEADIAEQQLRRDIAEYKRRNLEQFVEGAARREPVLSPEQQRRLKRMEIEERIEQLDRREQSDLSKAPDEQERRRIQNMYADKRAELREELEKYLA